MTVASGKVVFRRQGVAVVRNAIGLVLLLLLAIAVWGAAAAKAENAAVQSDTDIVANLGMLQGDEGGLTPAYLAKPTMRIQAAIMYLRLKGLEQAALAYKGTDNFEDAVQVGDSNKTIMAYLKAHPELGWAGTGNNKFDPLAVISAQQYYKVMLEALGYKQDADFAYDDAIAFAGKLGLHRAAGAASFHNADIATATVEALQTAVKGGKKLVETLAEAGSLDAAKAAALTYP
ncbi:MAG: hypothetical protein J7639_33655, partial [Paenibacillaceae bacterium]|nr:hypothetical protein [Paenibacillaceae bacterium]